MNMNYKMIVDIYDPNAPVGMSYGERLCLFCEVFCDFKNYGNGCYVSISGKDFFRNVFDVRYDKSFHINEPDVWLKNWAKNNWNGCYGAWSIKSLQILKLN